MVWQVEGSYTRGMEPYPTIYGSWWAEHSGGLQCPQEEAATIYRWGIDVRWANVPGSD